MFGGYEDIEAYEDDLYREESSSELSVDSEVEFHLYSQIHYAQSLREVSGHEETAETDSRERQGQSSNSVNNQDKQKGLIVISDSDVIQISDAPEVIILSDTPDEDSVYKSKVKKSATSLSPGQNKERRANKKSMSVFDAGSHIIHEILVIEDSSSDKEEEMSSVSESDHVESWMLLGCSAEDKDENILLNLEGCESSVSEGQYFSVDNTE
uniref:Zinc finger CCHC domain-containing protein 7 n=1 Tax=Sphenodon punctatus TaxID=8508 RepID=A0A8D0L741_SPHPU